MSEKLTFENIDPKVRKMAMIGLALGMLVACMDGTIVGTCANTISKDLGGQDMYSWIITAYLLCESAMVPIAGKMSDRYGRKPLFMIGLVLFGIGSICSGLSSSIYDLLSGIVGINAMEVLIISRGIQGLGGGIIIPVAMAAVADFYSPENRGKVQGMLGAVFGIGSGIGPLVGGCVCEGLDWNWIFFINVPLIMICLVLTFSKFPEQDHNKQKRIDYVGIAVLTALILDVLLYFQWITEDMTFFSVKSVAMIAIASVLLGIFVAIEEAVEDPVLSPRLAHNRIVVKSAAYMFIMGLAMIGTLSFIALYIQQLYDVNTMKCGLCLLPLVFGMMFTSMGSGMSVNRTGYRIWIITGSVIIMTTLVMMSFLGSDSPLWMVLVCLFFFGLGLGCVNSTVMISVQNNTRMEDMGMTTSAMSLMRNIGSTVGTAAFSLIISSQMNARFADTVYAPMADAMGLHGTGLLALKFLNNPELTDTVVDILGNSVCAAFLFAGLLYVVALAIAFTTDKGYTVGKEE